MRRILIFFITILFLVLANGCKKPMTPEEAIEKTKLELIDEFDNKTIDSKSLLFYSHKQYEDLTVFLTWESDKPYIINNLGIVVPSESTVSLSVSMKCLDLEDLVVLRIIVPRDIFNKTTSNDTSKNVHIELSSIEFVAPDKYIVKFDVFNNTDRIISSFKSIIGSIYFSNGDKFADINASYICDGVCRREYNNEYKGVLNIEPNESGAFFYIEGKLDYQYSDIVNIVTTELIFKNAFYFAGTYSWYYKS